MNNPSPSPRFPSLLTPYGSLDLPPPSLLISRQRSSRTRGKSALHRQKNPQPHEAHIALEDVPGLGEPSTSSRNRVEYACTGRWRERAHPAGVRRVCGLAQSGNRFLHREARWYPAHGVGFLSAPKSERLKVLVSPKRNLTPSSLLQQV